MKVRQRKSAEKVYKDCEGKKDMKGKMGIVCKNTVIKKAFLKWKNEKTANTKYILYLQCTSSVTVMFIYIKHSI